VFYRLCFTNGLLETVFQKLFRNGLLETMFYKLCFRNCFRIRTGLCRLALRETAPGSAAWPSERPCRALPPGPPRLALFETSPGSPAWPSERLRIQATFPGRISRPRFRGAFPSRNCVLETVLQQYFRTCVLATVFQKLCFTDSVFETVFRKRTGLCRLVLRDSKHPGDISEPPFRAAFPSRLSEPRFRGKNVF